MNDFLIDAGLTSGLAGFPKKLQLVTLRVELEDEYILIKYKDYSLVGGEKVQITYHQYILKNPIKHVNRFGEIIQSKDINGNLEFETIQQRVLINDVIQFEQDGITELMQNVQVPKPLLGQFTKWIDALGTTIWDGVLKDGIKDHYKL